MNILVLRVITELSNVGKVPSYRLKDRRHLLSLFDDEEVISAIAL
jgi:hypothetical protein